MNTNQKFITFNESVQGFLHIKKGKPCEDASDSYSDPNGNFYIAIVADGHGSDEYVRAQNGSKFAVEVTMDLFKQTAEEYLESKRINGTYHSRILQNSNDRKLIIRNLTDRIIKNWINKVRKHLEENPLENEEILTEQQKRELYGTTLIGALWLSDCIIIIQQGDGQCEIFQADGKAIQPVPWDERCQGNVTTSMCNIDVMTSIRSLVINLEEEPIAAVFVGSDGVDDAYYDSDSTHKGVDTFYKNIIIEILEKGEENFLADLSEELSQFSKQGKFVNNASGDDVSIAGIINLTLLASFVVKYKDEIKAYKKVQKLRELELKKKSLLRKHEVLAKRVQSSKEKLEKLQKQFIEQKTELDDLQSEFNQIEDQIKLKTSEILSTNNDINELLNITSPYSRTGIVIIDEFITQIGVFRKVKEKIDLKKAISDERSKLSSRFNLIKNELHSQKSTCENLLQTIKDAESEAIDAELEFKEFDDNFKNIEDEILKISQEIQVLENPETVNPILEQKVDSSTKISDLEKTIDYINEEIQEKNELVKVKITKEETKEAQNEDLITNFRANESHKEESSREIISKSFTSSIDKQEQDSDKRNAFDNNSLELNLEETES